MDFKDAMSDYLVDFIFDEIVQDTFDYAKLFGLWKYCNAFCLMSLFFSLT